MGEAHAGVARRAGIDAMAFLVDTVELRGAVGGDVRRQGQGARAVRQAVLVDTGSMRGVRDIEAEPPQGSGFGVRRQGGRWRGNCASSSRSVEYVCGPDGEAPHSASPAIRSSISGPVPFTPTSTQHITQLCTSTAADLFLDYVPSQIGRCGPAARGHAATRINLPEPVDEVTVIVPDDPGRPDRE